MTQRNLLTRLLALLLIFVFAKNTQAQQTQNANETISFQGRLTTPNNTALEDGTYSVSFALYDQSEQGSPLWSETQQVTTRDGVFSAQLGAITAMTTLPFDKDYYLGVTLDGQEMTPRTPH